MPMPFFGRREQLGVQDRHPGSVRVEGSRGDEVAGLGPAEERVVLGAGLVEYGLALR